MIKGDEIIPYTKKSSILFTFIFIFILIIPIFGILLFADQPTGKQRAIEFAEKFQADSISCVLATRYIYKCTMLKSNILYSVECWNDGCALR